jgi:hypothetical protein
MGTKLGDFVIKFLQDKTETRKIIRCDYFFQLIENMGIADDSDEIMDIINYLEVNNTDINFHESKTQNYYIRFRHIESRVKMSKILLGSKTEVQKMIGKVMSIKIQERPDWLETYRNDDEDSTPIETSNVNFNLSQDIIDRLRSEDRDRINNEPKITMEEIQEQITNEINNK